ncbi:hypothetical protein GGD54_005651 [Rhizobium tropici]|uniref:Uncharacterized protein n=2 Tax=Rhizobium TaxID=379 RepID=A0A1C3XBC6_9HYPH|nr:hypothetical protein [Rhizobium tropici]MBB6304908.1 hypothetical protein [Rhizobium leucaenae]MBB6488236.1 hypothetical protein [Rhizobium lusitanum]MBB5596255.1 hypothetical protein [Rhizobium tropici]MBB6495168.1 hypothetical protein [Rhizobium tropici]
MELKTQSGKQAMLSGRLSPLRSWTSTTASLKARETKPSQH